MLFEAGEEEERKEILFSSPPGPATQRKWGTEGRAQKEKWEMLQGWDANVHRQNCSAGREGWGFPSQSLGIFICLGHGQNVSQSHL